MSRWGSIDSGPAHWNRLRFILIKRTLLAEVVARLATPSLTSFAIAADL